MITSDMQAPEGVPGHILYVLKRYVFDRIEPTEALRCLLSNDLRRFLLHATDDWTVPVLRRLMSFVEDELPPDSWGTPEKVQAWLARRSPVW